MGVMFETLVIAAVLAAAPGASGASGAPGVTAGNAASGSGRATALDAGTSLAPVSSLPAVALQKTSRRLRNGVKREARVIPLDETQARVFHTVIAHPTTPVVLEFPEPLVGALSCGDCVDLASPPEVLRASDALFGVQVFQAEQYLIVKPAQYSRRDGGRIAEENYLTTLTVRLQSKLTVTVRVQYGAAAQSDWRVVFTLPQRGAESRYIQEQLDVRRKELEDGFVERIDEGVQRGFLKALMEPHQCIPMGARNREDNIIVEVKELCRFGNSVFISFELENRLKSPVFEVGDVVVRRSDGKESSQVDGVSDLVEKPQLVFQEVVPGVVGFQVDEHQGKAHAYELHIYERGGRGREVVAAGLTF